MKLGFGLYRHQLDRDHYRFARQCGATHIVAHLVDYFRDARHANARGDQPLGDSRGWGRAGDPDRLWTTEEITTLRDDMATEGLTLHAIENFDPAHWHDILLDGPRRAVHIENIHTLIRRCAAAGVAIIGYNFSIAGVAARIKGNFARGHAGAVGMEGNDDTPIPHGMVWNMIYDEHAPAGTLPEISEEELWRRHDAFLRDVLPVAEECGIRLALHPDDPPVERVRRQPRLVWRPDRYQRILNEHPTPAWAMEFCVGTLAEMPDHDIYETVARYAATGRIGYVHLRNITGHAPSYRETFVDDGDVDLARILRILHEAGFHGVVIPDHAPQMSCAAPWHAGMAFAMGWMKHAINTLSPAPPNN